MVTFPASLTSAGDRQQRYILEEPFKTCDQAAVDSGICSMCFHRASLPSFRRLQCCRPSWKAGRQAAGDVRPHTLMSIDTSTAGTQQAVIQSGPRHSQFLSESSC